MSLDRVDETVSLGVGSALVAPSSAQAHACQSGAAMIRAAPDARAAALS
jgi:hypothetical protein